MYRLVLSVLVSSLLLHNVPTNAKSLLDDEDWAHPILFKNRDIRTNSRADDVNYRLSGDLIPINYNIWLYSKLHLNDASFSGKVIITLRAERDTNEIVLHAMQQKISEAEIQSLTTDDYWLLYPKSLNTTTDFLTLASMHVDELKLVQGQEYLLTITYESSLRRDNGGFYLSSYENDKGENAYLATTQFEATDARHAFPCFDEPGFKATFDIAIQHGREYTAVSNMPRNRLDETSATLYTSYFATTPKMSTYLIAFIISNFEYTRVVSEAVEHRVYSRPEFLGQQNFALNVSKDGLNALRRYLGVSYSLPKVDNVAIPDFGAGAMENWGLVTYREEYLLYDEKKSTINTKINIAIMIVHEFTHQWFGNLVTPKWWEYLWLNEGFASLYEYLIVNELFPEFDIMQNFQVAHFQRALLADGTASPRPMSYYVEDPASISRLFDSVAYPKSACVLRMFQHVLGEDVFQRGLTSYLNAKSYDVVVEDDLFEHLTEAAKNENIPGLANNQLTDFFKSWTNNGGSPVLTVTRAYSAKTFEIKQEYFDNTNSPSSQLTFVVPYNYVYGNSPNFTNTRPRGFMNKVSQVVVDSNGALGSSEWLLLNPQQTSYYRVNYDSKNWELLQNQLVKDHTKINVINRAQLIDDTVRLAFAGRLSPTVALSLLRYLEKEEDYAPWAATNNIFAALNTYFLGDGDYELYQYYVAKLVTPFYKKLGVTQGINDSLHKKLTRNIAINWACRAGVESCLNDTNTRLNTIIDSGVDIDPDLKVAVLCNGLLKGGEVEYHYIFRRILDSNDQAERRQLMPTMGCSTNETLLMEFAMTSTAYSSEINYRTQERTNVMSAVIDRNEAGLRTGMKFLKENHADYYYLGAGGFMDSNPLLTILSSIASKVYSKELVEEFALLIAEVKTGELGASAQLDTMVTRARNNLKWVETNRENYMVWLDKFKNSASSAVLSSITLVVTVVISMRAYF